MEKMTIEKVIENVAIYNQAVNKYKYANNPELIKHANKLISCYKQYLDDNKDKANTTTYKKVCLALKKMRLIYGFDKDKSNKNVKKEYYRVEMHSIKSPYDSEFYVYDGYTQGSVSDNKIRIKYYEIDPNSFFGREINKSFSLYVYAVKDEKGLHEIISGKTLKKWSLEEKPSSDYYYYENLYSVSEEDVANGLAPILSKNDPRYYYKSYYENLLSNYQGLFIRKQLDYYIKKNREKAEEKRKTLNNVSTLNSYKPNR